MAQVAGEIQQRLHSLEDIRHLLRSIRAMSAIRWRRARARLQSAQKYATTVDRQLALATTFPTALTRGIHKTRLGEGSHAANRANAMPGECVGLIALTSDRGLCGTFNVGVVSHALDFIERARGRKLEVKLISLGGYGEKLFCRAGCEALYTERFPLTHAVSFVEARDIVAKVKQLYEARAFDTLYLIYNQFISFGQSRRVELRLLPPDLAAIWRNARDSSGDDRGLVPEDLILGTSPQALQEFLLWEHLAMQVYRALIESMVSEQGARLQTMDAAIANLDESVEQLQLQYHAVRQEGITQEVLAVQSNSRSGLLGGAAGI